MRLVSLAALAALVVPAPAFAGEIEDAAEALGSDPVYVDEQAERAITPAEADRLRDRIRTAEAGPLYVAILPQDAVEEAGGDPGGVVTRLHDELGREGTYAVVVGNSLRAGSTDVEGTGDLAAEALEQHRDEGVAPTLVAFVDAVGAERNPDTARDGDDGGGFPWVLAFLVGIPAALFLVLRRRRNAERQADLAGVRSEVEADLVALADDVRALDDDVERPDADPRAKEAYTRALDRYEEASRAFERARSADDLEPVGASLEEGRWEMAVAKAVLEGREPPERTPPCFFDPRHGPSVAQVEWAPPGGMPRPVPVCEDDRRALERNEAPAVREVAWRGRRVPYWQAGPAYGPYTGGFFGGGILPGILIGSMLGGGLGDPFDGGGGADDLGDLGGGDFGGDFDGGDFGGGDF